MGDLFDILGGSSYYYSSGPNISGAMAACFFIAIVGAVVLMATFLTKKYDMKFTGFVDFLRDFLNFKKLLVEILLRFLYITIAIFCTLGSFVLLFTGEAGGFFALLIGGNLFARITFELIMLVIIIARNVTEINKKTPGVVPEEKLAFKKPEAPKPAAEQGGAFCSKCGSPQSSDAAFCANCGASLK